MFPSQGGGVPSHATLWPLPRWPGSGYSNVTVPGAVIVSVFAPVPLADHACGWVGVKVAVDWPCAGAGVTAAQTSAAATSSLRPIGDPPSRLGTGYARGRAPVRTSVAR